jgi:hypothetical protein
VPQSARSGGPDLSKRDALHSASQSTGASAAAAAAASAGAAVAAARGAERDVVWDGVGRDEEEANGTAAGDDAGADDAGADDSDADGDARGAPLRSRFIDGAATRFVSGFF